MQNKAFSQIGIIIILIILLGGGYFGWQYFEEQKEEAKILEGPHVEMIFPNGGEKLVVGEEYNIRWKTENLPSNAQVLINIRRDDGGVTNIVEGVSHQYLWNVNLNELLCWSWGASCINLDPDEVLKHEFKIEVKAYWPNTDKVGYNISIKDESDNSFSIKD